MTFQAVHPAAFAVGGSITAGQLSLQSLNAFRLDRALFAGRQGRSPGVTWNKWLPDGRPATEGQRRKTLMDDVRASVKAYLRAELDAAKLGTQLDDDTKLIESGIIDSLGIMKLLQYLEESFSIHIGDDELRPENFETPGIIASLVEKKLSPH